MPPNVFATVATAMAGQNRCACCDITASNTASELPGSNVAERNAESAKPARPASGENSNKVLDGRCAVNCDYRLPCVRQ